MSAKEHIKVVAGEDQKTITLLPNPKTPGVKLYFIGSSAESALSMEERKTPVSSLTLPLKPEEKIQELIVLETQVGDVWHAHFLEVIWKQRGPYIDLDKQWIPKSENPMLINSLVGGRVRLTMSIGKGKHVMKYSAHADELPEGYHFAQPDWLCKAAVGELSPAVLRKKVLPGSESIPVAQAPTEPAAAVAEVIAPQEPKVSTEEIRALTEKYEKLQAEYKKLQTEKEFQASRLSIVETNAKALGGVVYKVSELVKGQIYVRGAIIRAEVDPYIATDRDYLNNSSHMPAGYAIPTNYRKPSK